MFKDKYNQAVSWNGILMGAVIGVGISFLLHLLVLATGLTAVGTDSGGAVRLAGGGFVLILLLGIAAMGLAGWIAGYLNRSVIESRKMGLLYGLLTWAIMLFLTVLLYTPMGQFIASYNIALANPELTAHLNPAETVSQQATVLAGLPFLVIFLIFGLGAVASSLGGYMGCKRKLEIEKVNRVQP